MTIAEYIDSLKERVGKLKEAAETAEKNYLPSKELRARANFLEDIAWGLQNLSQDGESSIQSNIERNCDRFKTGNPDNDMGSALKAYTEETGKLVYNCSSKYTSSGEFLFWLMSQTTTKKEKKGEVK